MKKFVIQFVDDNTYYSFSYSGRTSTMRLAAQIESVEDYIAIVGTIHDRTITRLVPVPEPLGFKNPVIAELGEACGFYAAVDNLPVLYSQVECLVEVAIKDCISTAFDVESNPKRTSTVAQTLAEKYKIAR